MHLTSSGFGWNWSEKWRKNMTKKPTPRVYGYDPETMMTFIADRMHQGIVTYCIYYHDESTIKKYEHSGYGWSSDNVKGLYAKSDGKSYNISDFLGADGWLRNGQDTARVIHRVGSDTKAGEYWWTNEHFQAQIANATRIHNEKYNLTTDYGKSLVRPIFCIDNSMTHLKRPEDALIASNMNVNPGLFFFNLFTTSFTFKWSLSP